MFRLLHRRGLLLAEGVEEGGEEILALRGHRGGVKIEIAVVWCCLSAIAASLGWLVLEAGSTMCDFILNI